jgi:hypothetical protein
VDVFRRHHRREGEVGRQDQADNRPVKRQQHDA